MITSSAVLDHCVFLISSSADRVIVWTLDYVFTEWRLTLVVVLVCLSCQQCYREPQLWCSTVGDSVACHSRRGRVSLAPHRGSACRSQVPFSGCVSRTTRRLRTLWGEENQRYARKINCSFCVFLFLFFLFCFRGTTLHFIFLYFYFVNTFCVKIL